MERLGVNISNKNNKLFLDLFLNSETFPRSFSYIPPTWHKFHPNLIQIFKDFFVSCLEKVFIVIRNIFSFTGFVLAKGHWFELQCSERWWLWFCLCQILDTKTIVQTEDDEVGESLMLLAVNGAKTWYLFQSGDFWTCLLMF